MKLTVATWNMDHWKRTPAQRQAAWQRLRNSEFDVALLQEAVPPPNASRQELVWREIGRERRFGSAVVSLKGWPIEEISTAKSCYSYLSFPLLGTFPGSVAIARVHPPGFRPITFISMYGVIDVYSTTTVLRQVADLVPLFDSVHGERVVLGGDLNISTQSAAELARHRAAFAAIESLGVVDLFRTVADRPQAIGAGCACKLQDCYHVRTHRNAARPDGSGSHLDYLFASEVLANRCAKLRVEGEDATWELSDHCPVVAEIELEDAGEPASWNERYASDVAETLRAALAEPRDWGPWKPGPSRPVVRTDRGLTKWISAFWEGNLSDGRAAQLELGIWRAAKETGHPIVAHAGLYGKPMTQKLDGIDIVAPAGSAAKPVTTPHARYLVVPFDATDLPPEPEIRAALNVLVTSIRI